VPATDPDPHLVALARDVERTKRRTAEVETLVRQLAADIAALPRTDTAEEGSTPRVRSWLLADDPGQAATDLHDLIEWVERVYLRYPDTALPTCWLWHPTAIEELRWLRDAHADAYSGPDAASGLAGDWHDRQRPGVTKRLREAVAGCELALHVPGAEHGQRPTAAPLAQHADPVAATWVATAGSPEPTPGQLVDAQRHDDHRHRNGARP